MIKFCTQCGNKTSKRVPEGEDRLRQVCDTCQHIHYLNPRIITGCLPVYEDQVLLCKRAIKPQYGLWTLPAGFLENGESMQQGAERETWEEARANVNILNLYTLINLPHINQVYSFYLANLANLDYTSGPESLEVELFSENDIPWDRLAFRVVVETLKVYFKDLQDNHFPLKHGDIIVHEINGEQNYEVMICSQ